MPNANPSGRGTHLWALETMRAADAEDAAGERPSRAVPWTTIWIALAVALVLLGILS